MARWRFTRCRPPTDEDVLALTERIVRRIARLLRTRDADAEATDPPELDDLVHAQAEAVHVPRATRIPRASRATSRRRAALVDGFSLHADIATVLRRDRRLAAMVKRRPGLRLPGAIDPLEAAVRALLGQQVSVAGATTLAGRFAAQLGERFVPAPGGDRSAIRSLGVRFPTADEVVDAGVARIARLELPMARATAIWTLARAVAVGELRLDRAADLDTVVANLVELPGIGPWSAHYLAMRALHAPDTFPAADLGVQKVIHLWTALGEDRA